MKNKSINDKIILYPILKDFLETLKLRNLSRLTILNYMNSVARFLDFIEYDNVFSINEQHIRKYLFYLLDSGHNAKSVNAANSSIRHFVLGGLDQPLNLYRIPMARTDNKEIDYLYDNQIISLLNASKDDSRMDCIIKLGLCCGLRINEVASLKICDLNTKNKVKTIYIRESKRNKSRTVPMDNTIYCAIQKYAKEYQIKPNTDLPLFTFNGKGHTCNETLRRNFYIYRDKANIQDTLTFHSLRHTYSVNFLRSGGSLIDLKYRLGHSSLSSTSRYLHFSSNMMNTSISYMDNHIGKERSYAY